MRYEISCVKIKSVLIMFCRCFGILVQNRTAPAVILMLSINNLSVDIRSEIHQNLFLTEIKKQVALGKPKRIVYKNMDGKIKELSSSDLMEGI